MPRNETAMACWTRLDGMKTALMLRVERYAALTIPKIMLPLGFDEASTDQTHDFQSIGAQAVNHVTNKLMISLFRPSQPFFRVQAGKTTLADMEGAGVPQTAVAGIFSKMEADACKELDARAQRPKLYQVMRHLVIAGNTLLHLGKDDMRVMGLRYFCVKRTARGKIHTLIIKERMCFDELDDNVQKACGAQYSPESEVDHYRMLIRQPGGDLAMTQWINGNQLPKEFNGKWPEAECPWRVLTWDLADEANYGTGLVEEYAGDLEALSVMAESLVNGAVLGTEYRWLVNPTGMTSADDLNKSANGDALPGVPADIAPTQGGNPQAIEVALNVSNKYEQRVSRGFLLNSAVTRDAERVTAEEIRATATELETSFGGVYSTLACSVQGPIAVWLLAACDTPIKGTDLKVVIITGLDALSRNGDLENLRLALADLAAVATMPPELQARLKMKELATFIGAGRGVDLAQFIKSDDEYAAEQAQAQQSRVNEAAATAGGEAAGQAHAEQGTQAQ